MSIVVDTSGCFSASGTRRDGQERRGDDDHDEPGRQPEHPVIPGGAVHQQTGHDEACSAAEAQRAGQHCERTDDLTLGEFVAQNRDADRIQGIRDALQHRGEDQQCERGRGRGEDRADEDDDEHWAPPRAAVSHC
jgi:hypothetical protein